jgi:hypothetical protein
MTPPTLCKAATLADKTSSTATQTVSGVASSAFRISKIHPGMIADAESELQELVREFKFAIRVLCRPDTRRYSRLSKAPHMV